MKKTRNKKEDLQPINEGIYDFYEAYEPGDSETTEKILNYYIDKIRKYGQNSLTKTEVQIFNDAKKGKLTLEKPVYKKNKITNEIEHDSKGEPIRLDKDIMIAGVPFITSKGKGGKKEEILVGRCYWNVDEKHKTFYIYGGNKSEQNPYGLVVWKTVSETGKEFGAFVVPKADADMTQSELWKTLNKKYDKGVILDKETYAKFMEFDKLFHTSKKASIERITELYNELKIYPPPSK